MFPKLYRDTTVILFWVKVPVLSVHIYVAPPIVSHDSNFLTRLFSFTIFALEKLKDIETANGRPSGIATAIIVIEIIIDLSSSNHSLLWIVKLKFNC